MRRPKRERGISKMATVNDTKHITFTVNSAGFGTLYIDGVVCFLSIEQTDNLLACIKNTGCIRAEEL